MKQAKITKDEFPVEQMIVIKQKNVKDAWYLVGNSTD